MSTPTSAADRLSRLLAMVPYLLTRQGVPLAAAARHFDITEDELVKDLELLFVCGLPGHMPGDLIEADWESGKVYLDNADTIARPLRLGLDEAITLLVGLRTLAAAPGAGDRDALDGALAKLSEATGDAGRAAGAVAVELDDEVAEQVLSTVRRALADRRRLHLRYLVPGRDEATDRDVDPMRVVSLAGHWYLEGWCHRADGVRLFRLGRVLTAERLDADGTPPPQARSRDLDDDLFTPSATDTLVTLDLGPRAQWVTDQYRPEHSEELPDGWLRIRLRTADTGWLRQLVLRSGGGVVVVEPPEVVTQVAYDAAEALARYT